MIQFFLLLVMFTAMAAAQAGGGPPQHTAVLTWTDPENPSGQTTYTVYRAPGLCSGTPAFSKIASGVPMLTLTDTTITIGAWCYQVTATVSGIEGPPSPQASAVLGPAAPGQISIVVK